MQRLGISSRTNKDVRDTMHITPLSGGPSATKPFQSFNMGVKRLRQWTKKGHNEIWMGLVVLLKVTAFRLSDCGLYLIISSKKFV